MSKASSKFNPGIYIHIPYCLKKCDYCAFISEAKGAVPAQYIASLLSEMEWSARLFGLAGAEVDTVYFGGGTPSLMAPGDLDRLLGRLSALFNLRENAEITLELNPATADKKRLIAFKETGVNRLSIGVQSFQPRFLNFLGRRHSPLEARRAVIDAHEAGFENVSLDLIYGLPHESDVELLADLHEAAALRPRHISLYLLTYEPDTPLQARLARGEFLPLPETRQEALFFRAAETLAKAGYERYETSSFALAGWESRHNLKYWSGRDYLGFGTAAHSYLKEAGWGMRWWNPGETTAYMARLAQGVLPLDDLEILSRKDALAEMVFTALRTRTGLCADHLIDRFGIGIEEALKMEALQNLPAELFLLTGRGLRLTDRGALLADEIAAKILF